MNGQVNRKPDGTAPSEVVDNRTVSRPGESVEEPQKPVVDPREGETLMVEEEETPFRWRDYGIEDGFGFFVFWGMAAIVFAQFFSRYVLNAPLGWTEEVARYLLVGVGFLGAMMGVRKNSHIYIEIFHRFMPASISQALWWVIDVFRTLFLGALTYSAYKILPIMQMQKMASIPVPLSVLYSVILLSLVVMTLRSVLCIWQRWRNRPKTDDPLSHLGTD